VICVFVVLCLIVVPLPPCKNPFAVQVNNNNNKLSLLACVSPFQLIFSDKVDLRIKGEGCEMCCK
jgi:hypothetical protein